MTISAATVPTNIERASFVGGISESASYTTEGIIRATYAGDAVEIAVSPVSKPRFLVVNEMFHPGWKAFGDGRELTVFPVNIVMRGLIVPANVTHIALTSQPFLESSRAVIILVVGFMVTIAAHFAFRSQRFSAIGRAKSCGHQ